MLAKLSCKTLGLVLLLSMVLESADCCSKGEEFQESTDYSFDISYERSFRAAVKVYSTICTLDVKAVGPSWYRLDVLGLAKDLGYFKEPGKYSGAVKTSEGIQFSSDEPLMMLDLPRQYKWEVEGDEIDIQDIKLCFRLVIQEGNSCRQVVSSNCTEELQQQILLEQQEENDNSSVTAPTTATVAAATEAEKDFSDVFRRHACIADNPRLNCTGKRVKATCGSDGLWYKNTCTLRLHRCMYGIVTLQRDLSNISCTSPPPTSFSPPAPPTTAPPPTLAPCSAVRANFIKHNHLLVPYCLDHTFFRPIQCWELDGGLVHCSCTDVLTGSSYFDWVPTCPSAESPPSLDC